MWPAARYPQHHQRRGTWAPPYNVIASQCAHWRGNPSLAPSVRGLASASETGGENLSLLFSPSDASRHLPLRGREKDTDSHTSDVGHWFGMTKRAGRVARPYEGSIVPTRETGLYGSLFSSSYRQQASISACRGFRRGYTQWPHWMARNVPSVSFM